jgi:hypothetical protein
MEREMVTLGGTSGLSFVNEPFVICNLLVFPVDLYVVPELVNLHLFSDGTFGDAVAVGIHVDIGLHIDCPIEGLVERGDMRGKVLEVGFFHEIGGLRAYPQRACGWPSGNDGTTAPAPEWTEALWRA